jgi:hypothetical protein
VQLVQQVLQVQVLLAQLGRPGLKDFLVLKVPLVQQVLQARPGQREVLAQQDQQVQLGLQELLALPELLDQQAQLGQQVRKETQD